MNPTLKNALCLIGDFIAAVLLVAVPVLAKIVLDPL